MLLADLTSAMTYAELTKVVEENGEPFESLQQCDLFLRAAGMLWRRVPEEADHDGERIRTRDLQEMMKEARKARGRFTMLAEKPTSIVPVDNLR